MPPRKKTAKPALPVPTPLPKNPQAILVLQRAVEELLSFLEPIDHGQVMRLTELQKTFKEPLRIVQQRLFLKAIEEANQQRFAQGGPSVSVLVPYVVSVAESAFSDFAHSCWVTSYGVAEFSMSTWARYAV